jgi:hypothetical protein
LRSFYRKLFGLASGVASGDQEGTQTGGQKAGGDDDQQRGEETAAHGQAIR